MREEQAAAEFSLFSILKPRNFSISGRLLFSHKLKYLTYILINLCLPIIAVAVVKVLTAFEEF